MALNRRRSSRATVTCFFVACRQDLRDVPIAVKAVRETGFDEHGDTKTWEFLFERPDGSRQQQAVAHRAESHQQNSGVGWELVEEVLGGTHYPSIVASLTSITGISSRIG